jgi:hypothetical protein
VRGARLLCTPRLRNPLRDSRDVLPGVGGCTAPREEWDEGIPALVVGHPQFQVNGQQVLPRRRTSEHLKRNSGQPSATTAATYRHQVVYIASAWILTPRFFVESLYLVEPAYSILAHLESSELSVKARAPINVYGFSCRTHREF